MSNTILISAGHSQTDPGAVANGQTESILALKLRDAIAAELRARKVSVLTDGADGVNEPLTKAIQLAKTVTVAGGAAVEIHFNAGPEKAKGVEALSLPTKKNIALSQALCKAISGITGSPLRGDNGWKDDTSGQHHRLGFCRAGGIVLEVCFISNKQELETYLANQTKIAKALAETLANAAK